MLRRRSTVGDVAKDHIPARQNINGWRSSNMPHSHASLSAAVPCYAVREDIGRWGSDLIQIRRNRRARAREESHILNLQHGLITLGPFPIDIYL